MWRVLKIITDGWKHFSYFRKSSQTVQLSFFPPTTCHELRTNSSFKNNRKRNWEGDAHTLDTMDCILAFHPMALGSILGIPNNFSLDADEIN